MDTPTDSEEPSGISTYSDWVPPSSLSIGWRPRLSSGEVHRGDQRSHEELTVHWSSRNEQRVTALVALALNVPNYMVILRNYLALYSIILCYRYLWRPDCNGQKSTLYSANWVLPLLGVWGPHLPNLEDIRQGKTLQTSEGIWHSSTSNQISIKRQCQLGASQLTTTGKSYWEDIRK